MHSKTTIKTVSNIFNLLYNTFTCNNGMIQCRGCSVKQNYLVFSLVLTSPLTQLVQYPVLTTDYTVSCHCSCRPANIGFTRDLRLPQQRLCSFHSFGIRFRVDRLEPKSFSQKPIAFFVKCRMPQKSQCIYIDCDSVATAHFKHTQQ